MPLGSLNEPCYRDERVTLAPGESLLLGRRHDVGLRRPGQDAVVIRQILGALLPIQPPLDRVQQV